MRCKICSTETKAHDSGRILGRYEVQFFRCPNCGFIQTEEPYWVYYGLDHGQHVAFYTREALLHVGRKYGMRLLSHGGFLHLLTRRNISSLQWNIALNRYSKFLITLLYRKPTLLWRDTDQAVE